MSLAESYSELNRLISALISILLTKRKVQYQTQQTEALCLSVYLYSSNYIFHRCTGFCVRLKPLSHKTMKSTRLYTKLGFFTPCRLRGGLCRLHDKMGTLPGTSYSLRDKPCSLHVRAEIFWLFKNFHELHMKFDLDIHHVNFMLTSCTLRGILVDYWLTSCYFVFTSYPN